MRKGLNGDYSCTSKQQSWADIETRECDAGVLVKIAVVARLWVSESTSIFGVGAFTVITWISPREARLSPSPAAS